jgi:hypothetical protein
MTPTSNAGTADAEMFDIGNGFAVCSNPGGRFHGWLFRKHPDGQYVSVRKLETVHLVHAFHPSDCRICQRGIP